MTGSYNKLFSLEGGGGLISENLSEMRNIERFYDEVFCCVYGHNIRKGSAEELQAENAMQLFSLSYALGKKKGGGESFSQKQRKVEDKIYEIKQRKEKGENIAYDRALAEINQILLEDRVSDLSSCNKNGSRLDILQNIIGKDALKGLSGDSRDIEEPLDQPNDEYVPLKLAPQIAQERTSIKHTVSDVLGTDRYSGVKDKSQYLIDQGFSYKRGIEVYYCKVREKCFTENDEEDEIEDKMQLFNIAYILCKYKFQDDKRGSGERYFQHLLSVLDLYLDNEKEPNFEGAMIAILHDIVEDTDIDWETLDYLFGKTIADGVCHLSKPSVEEYLTEEVVEGLGITEKALWLEWKKSGFLNSKGDLSDDIKKRHYFDKQNPDASTKLITSEEKQHIEIFKKINGKYKTRRNIDYFERFKEKGLRGDLSEQDKTELKVKCYDRIHNTKTLLGFLPDDMNDDEEVEKGVEKILSKIDETIKYFLPVTGKLFPEIHEMLVRDLDTVCLKLSKKLSVRKNQIFHNSAVLRMAKFRIQLNNKKETNERVNAALGITS